MTINSDIAPVPGTRSPATPTRRWKSLAVTWLRRLLVSAVVVGAGYYLVSRWDEFWRTLETVPWFSALLSMAAVLGGMLIGAMAWQVVVNDLGRPINRIQGAQIFLVSQLGKYVPGSVWVYVLQMELGKKAGIARARIFVSSLVQVAVAVVAMLSLGMIALPKLLDQNPRAVWLYVALPFSVIVLLPKVLTWGVNLVLKLLRKRPLDHQLRWSTIGKTLALSVLAYILFGVHLWLLVTAGGTPRLDLLVLCVGTIAVGLVAGLLFFIVPSGAGARDVLVALALVPTVGITAAAAFAVASRVMFTVAELATAGLAALLARVREAGVIAGKAVD